MKFLSCFSKDYLAYRAEKIFFTSDLLTTRAAVGLSSFLFGSVLLVHLFLQGHLHDLFWVMLSFSHAIITWWSLLTDRVSRLSFIGEAVAGFILWNYIALSLFLRDAFTEANYSPAGASMAPTFVIGLATWWILSRYPNINNKKQDTKICQCKK